MLWAQHPLILTGRGLASPLVLEANEKGVKRKRVTNEKVKRKRGHI